MGVVTVYHGDTKRTLEEVSALLFRANQALSTLERYRFRLDEVSSALSAREVEDAVTVRDVVLTLQRAEMMRRIAGEVADHVIELGTEGRLIQLQLDELVASVADERELVVRDYLGDRRRKLSVLADVAALSTDELLDAEQVAEILAYDADQLEQSGHAARVPAAVDGSRAFRRGSWNGWSTGSAPCPASWRPRSRSSTRSRASASPAPGRSRRVCGGWRRPACSTVTSDRSFGHRATALTSITPVRPADPRAETRRICVLRCSSWRRLRAERTVC
jgi:hypothetical protein